MSGIWSSVCMVWLLTYRIERLLCGAVFWIGVFAVQLMLDFLAVL
uniref:Uncharacterized protein n=1 Tax=Rhodnius prolixus TaxID=13249 RepID=T1ID57_RHOPR